MHGPRTRPPRQLQALPGLNTRAQVHLLSNTLSLVGGLLRRRPEAAEDLLGYLTQYLAGQIRPAWPLVSLREELRLVMLFVGVERARLGGRLRFEIACEPNALDVPVPPLILQPLVENAIRHGVARRAAGGRVRLTARARAGYLHLAVSDDGAGLRRPFARPGWGLVGVRLRLAALWGEAARLRLMGRPGAGALAAVTIPVPPIEAAR
ncbi:MAG: histidine kinase [Armatimonadota bacterium]|nr:histidine kinase [Armatimonadota bacterium]